MCGSRVPRRFRFGPLIRRMDLPILVCLISVELGGFDGVLGSVELKDWILGDEIRGKRLIIVCWLSDIFFLILFPVLFSPHFVRPGRALCRGFCGDRSFGMGGFAHCNTTCCFYWMGL